MKETVSVAQAATAQEARAARRGCRRRWASWSGAAKEGLLALSVGVGLGVLAELMEEEVDEVVGPKGKRDPDRTAVRHGHEAGEVTLGGRRVAVERPRVADRRRRARGAAGDLRALRRPRPADPAWCSSRCSPASRTRRFARTREPVGEEVARRGALDVEVGDQPRVRRRARASTSTRS